MPWNGSGSYSPPAVSFPEVDGTTIEASRFNNTILDLAAGLTNALTKDGQNAPTQNLTMGGFKHTNASPAVGVGQYLVYGQSNAVLGSLTLTGAQLYADGTAAAPAISFTSDSNTGLYRPANDTLGFSTNGVFRGEVGPNGNWNFGTVAGTLPQISGVASRVTTYGTAADQHDYAAVRYSVDNQGPFLRLGKVKGATPGTFLAVASGDALGTVSFNGADAVAIAPGSAIVGSATQTWTSTAHGSQLGFLVAANNATTLTEVFRVTSTGATLLQGDLTLSTGTIAGSGASLTNLNATNLASGTVPNARITGAYSGFTTLTTSGLITAGGGLTATANTNGAVAINFATERSWTVRQRGTGAAANLSFENTTGKSIEFSNDGTGVAAIGLTPSPGGAANFTVLGTIVTTSLISTTLTGTLTGNLVGNVTGNVTGSSGSTTGNAATATALQTARTINGTAFDGTSNITVGVAAANITGTSLPAAIVSSSLTQIGTLSTLAVTGNATANGIFTNAAGTAGAPAHTWTSDPNTGFFNPAADNLGVAVAGNEVARWNNSGHLVPGVSSTYNIGGSGQQWNVGWFADLRIGGADPKFASAETACPTTTSTNVFVHNRGRAPNVTAVVLRCVVAELGFALSDEVDVIRLDATDASRAWQIVNNVNQNTVVYVGTAAPAVRRTDTGALVTVTPANWRLVMRCTFL